jgi:hypothetical protein
MPYPKKHHTDWFTTADLRAINLRLVTDVRLHKSNGQIIGATVYQQIRDGEEQAFCSVSAIDAARLFDLLF